MSSRVHKIAQNEKSELDHFSSVCLIMVPSFQQKDQISAAGARCAVKIWHLL